MASEDFKLNNALTLDATLDDIEDMPGFKIPVSGAYKMTFTGGAEQDDPLSWKLDFKIDEVIEIVEKGLDPNDDDDKPPIVGDIMSLMFMRDNKLGVDAFKKVMKPIAVGMKIDTKDKPISELFHECKEAKLLVVIRRKWNEKHQAHFCNVKKIAVI